MTIKDIDTSISKEYNLYWNLSNIEDSDDWTLSFKSQWSNTVLIEPSTITITSSDRFTTITFTLDTDDFPSSHINGIYEAELASTTLGASYKQLVKLVSVDGGGTGTVAYESNNENRQAIVYYNPQY